MESVIRKLSEIEAAASRILEGAANQKKILDGQLSERLSAFDRELDEKTGKELEKIQSELKQKTDRELMELRQRTSHILTSLDEYYETNHDTLSTEICEKLIRK